MRRGAAGALVSAPPLESDNSDQLSPIGAAFVLPGFLLLERLLDDIGIKLYFW